MKSTIEVLIHLKKFTNIDLFSQGIYQFRISVANAQPYLIFDTQITEQSHINTVENKYTFFESNLDDNYFYTPAFLIRYEEEEMPLNIGCVFRNEIQVIPIQPITILIELLFIDKKQIPDIFDPNLPQLVNTLKSQMTQVSKCTLQINDPMIYNQAYFPLEFDAQHFCLLQTQIHSTPINFQFRQVQGLQQYVNEIIHTQEGVDKFVKQYFEPLLSCRDNILKKLNQLGAQENQKQFLETYKHQSYQLNAEIGSQLQTGIHTLHHDVYMVWMEFISRFKFKHEQIQNILEQELLFFLKEKWINCVVNSKSEIKDLFGYRESGKQNQEIAVQKRKQLTQQFEQSIIYLELNLPLNVHPLIFRNSSIRNQFFQKNYNTYQHYVVLVHGYQGTSYDMRLWKSILSIKFKENIKLIPVTSNDSTSNTDIEVMGRRLAAEVRDYLMDDNATQFRLSFLGHSLGGVVIRAALPHLVEFQSYMHTYISLASPHCGYASSKSYLVDTGLFMIQKWNKCKTLEQLNQKDHPDIRQTFIYKLSKLPGMEWFNNVVVLASYQDHYVPYHSARLEQMEDSRNDHFNAYNEVVKNILDRCNKIDRFDINFVINKKKIDKMIGRAAHIEFIDNITLVKMFIYLYDEYFH